MSWKYSLRHIYGFNQLFGEFSEILKKAIENKEIWPSTVPNKRIFDLNITFRQVLLPKIWLQILKKYTNHCKTNVGTYTC